MKTFRNILPSFWFFLISLNISNVVAQNLTDAQIQLVIARLADGAKQSWELGTRAQALTEYDTPSFSVLNNTSLPPSTSAPSSLIEVLEIAQNIVSNRSNSNDNATGPQPLIADGAAGDPASIGVSVILANWTGMSNSTDNYAGAASDQIAFLLEKVPQTGDGAISHRTDQVQLWSDFVYMVPPFLAYYGVITQNQSMVQNAYNQCKLYRNYLLDTSTGSNGLWKHIVLGSGVQDNGHWSTGNGWAAAGMLRVLGTIKNSNYAGSMKNQMNDLSGWVKEIQDGMYANLQSSGLFNNYADNSSTFQDASSTALMASTVYRLSLLSNIHTHLPLAEKSRLALSASSSSSNSNSDSNSSNLNNMAHFTSDGWLTPVVNPNSFGQQGQNSPEGQAFVVEMQAAWRDWVQNGAVGANAAKTGREVSMVFVGLVVLLVSVFVGM